MNYRDYKDARDASWRILIDCKVTELPVKISGVCRALGVPDFPAHDWLNAAAVGIVSGWAATGLNQSVKQLSDK